VLLRDDTAGQAPERRTVSVGFLSVLRAMATVSPVLVAVDDAQWLDRPSAAVLGFAVRRLDAEPVRVVTAVRLAADTDALGTFDRQVAESRRQAVQVTPLRGGALQIDWAASSPALRWCGSVRRRAGTRSMRWRSPASFCALTRPRRERACRCPPMSAIW
jgi:hypothetical protein